MQHSDWLNLSQIWSLKSHPVHTTPYGTGKTYVHPPPSLNIIWLVQRVQASTVATFTSSTTRVMGGRVYLLESFKKLSLCGRQWWWSHHSVPTFRKPLPIAKREPHPLRSAHVYNCVCKSQDHINFKSEEVRQEAGPDVIWRLADAAWLHSCRVWSSHCL